MLRFDQRLFVFSILIAFSGCTLISCQKDNVKPAAPVTPPTPPVTSTNQLSITNISKTWGTRGTTFIIEGQNFDPVSNNNIVKMDQIFLALAPHKRHSFWWVFQQTKNVNMDRLMLQSL
jgi:hypothetical protein